MLTIMAGTHMVNVKQISSPRGPLINVAVNIRLDFHLTPKMVHARAVIVKRIT